MQIAPGHLQVRHIPQCPQNSKRSSFLVGRTLTRSIGCQKRYNQKLVTCKQRGQSDDDAQISPSNPLQSLFGGTRRIKAEAQEQLQAPKQAGQPGKGTQMLKQGRNPFSGGDAGKGAGTKTINTMFLRSVRKDPDTVFVAGATGRLGARIVKMLLEKDNKIKVRAGVRNMAKATEYLQTATTYGLLPSDANRRVQLVEVDITDPDSIGPAIGNASKVVQAIGAPESEALNFGNPKKIDGDGAIALVDAAVALGVDQYVMVTSLGTAKIGFPAAVLNLFGGILIQKRRAEVALEKSGLNYVIVRPGGMERPTDSYKETHNVRLSTADTLFGGQVSRWQVAELIAAAVADPTIAENKVLEVVAEETAPLRSYEDLLSAAPSDVSQADKVAKEQAREEAAQQLEEARQKVAEAQQAAQQAKQQVQEQSSKLQEVQRQAAEAKNEAGPLLRQSQQKEEQLEKLRAQAQQSQRKEAAAKAVLAAAKDAARKGRALSAEERSSVERPILYPEQAQTQTPSPQQKPRPAAAKPKAPPMPVQARTQEEAAAKAKEAFSSQPKASAKSGRSFFERLRPEKADVPAQAPVAAKTKEEAIARSKNVSSQQTLQKDGPQAAAASPQTDRAPAPRRKEPKPFDPKEAERRREGAAKAAAEARSIEERVLRAAEEERQKKEMAARAKAREADKKRQEAEAKRRQETEAKVKADREAAAKKVSDAFASRPAWTGAFEPKLEAKIERPAWTGIFVPKGDAEAKAVTPEVAETEAKSTGKAPRGKNADEARQWIDAWREGSKGAAPPAAEAKSGTDASAAKRTGVKSEGVTKGKNADEAREWIEAWRKDSKSRTQPTAEAKSGTDATSSESNGAGKAIKSEGVGKAGPGKDKEAPENVREAREWIRSWRASKLEKSLPTDVEANSK